MRKKLMLILILLLVMSSFSTAVFAQETNEKVLVASLKEKIDTFDVFKSALAEPLRVLALVSETLTVYDEDLNVKPLLAKSWEVSDDQLTWTFHLKEGIEFHDGTSFNAEILKDYLVNWMIPKSFNGWQFGPIEEMEVVDEYTLAMKLTRPYPMLAAYFADPWNIIQSPVALEKHGERYGFDALVGTGPYIFDNWERGSQVVLKKDPNYKHGPEFLSNQGPAHLDKIIFRVVPEPVTLVSELRYGNIDLVQKVPEAMLEEVQNDENITTMIKPSFRVVFMSFNQEKELMQDIRIREAINHAVNRNAVLDAAFRGYGQKANSLLPPSSTGYWDGSEEFAKDYLYYNPEESKKLLKESGWVLPDNGKYRVKDGKELELDLVVTNVPRYKIPAEVVQSMLGEIGIKVNLQIYDSAAASARLESGEFDFTVTGWAYNMGEVTLDLICSEMSIPNPNYARYKNSELEQQLENMRLGQTASERQEAANNVQKMIIEDQVVVPLVIRTNSIAAVNEVKGLDKLDQHPWWLDLSLGLELDK